MSAPVLAGWALRDLLAGKRGLGLLAAALVPVAGLAAIVATAGQVPPGEAPEVVAGVVVGLILPFLCGLIAIVAGGAVLRRPLEEGTLLYQLVRPVGRARLGLVRAGAAAVVTAGLTLLSALLVGAVLGEFALVLRAWPGLLAAGLCFGALYGVLISLHRYALGLAVLHLVAEGSLAHVGFRVHRVSLTWHAYGGLGDLGTIAARIDAIPATDGLVWLPVLVAGLALGGAAALFRFRPFNLGLTEA